MTVAKRYKDRVKYHCDICGADDFWQPTWARVSSFAHDEACPDDVPTVCSDECRKELDVRLEDGRVELPRLKFTAGGAVVAGRRRGY
jgi:hypothetical protein